MKYVGLNVGDTVGATLGAAEGRGVGEATETNVTVPLIVVVTELLKVIMAVIATSSMETDVTVVPSGMPLPVTEAPTEGVLSEGFMVDRSTWPMKPWYVAPFSATETAPSDKYVGESVGSAVGALEGESEGCGVGDPAVNVGARVGDAVGALEGEALGLGVGLPLTYVGVNVGDAVGAEVGSIEGSGVGTSAR